MLRLHVVLQTTIEEQQQQQHDQQQQRDQQQQHDQQQQQLMLDDINRCIETYLGVPDQVDADNCSGWLLGLMNALDQKKVRNVLL
jgi:hypothetical protein